jgi:hypothetical protein
MAVSTAVAVAVGVWLASRAGGGEGVDTGVLVPIGGLLFLGGLLSAWPSLGAWLIKDEHWGMSVLAVTGTRTLLAMFAMLLLIEVGGLPRQAVVYGLLSGTLILTTAEAASAVWQLQRRETARASMNPKSTHPVVAAPARRSM